MLSTTDTHIHFMAFFQISLNKKQKRCVLGQKSKFEKKKNFDNSDLLILDSSVEKIQKCTILDFDGQKTKKVRIGPRIKNFESKNDANSILKHKCQKKGKMAVSKILQSNEIFINKKVRKWKFGLNNKKILLIPSTSGQNFRLFWPKTKKFSFNQLFLMPFFEPKY